MSKLIELHESVWEYTIDTGYPKYDNQFKEKFIQEMNNSKLGVDFKVAFQDYCEDYMQERNTVLNLITQCKYIGPYNYRKKWETLFSHLSNYVMTEAIVTILPALYYAGIVDADTKDDRTLLRKLYYAVYVDAPNSSDNTSLTSTLRRTLLGQIHISETYSVCLKLYGIPINISVAVTPLFTPIFDTSQKTVDSQDSNLEIIDISTKISFITQNGDYVEHTLKHYITEE